MTVKELIVVLSLIHDQSKEVIVADEEGNLFVPDVTETDEFIIIV